MHEHDRMRVGDHHESVLAVTHRLQPRQRLFLCLILTDCMRRGLSGEIADHTGCCFDDVFDGAFAIVQHPLARFPRRGAG